MDPFCPVHGFQEHCLIHEAGHAVAAIEHEIAFIQVAVLPPENWHQTVEGATAGGVTLPGDLRDVAATLSHTKTFEFALAGVQAERVILGHELHMSFLGDVNLWRRTVGIIGADQMAEIEDVLGQPLMSAAADVEEWVEVNRDEILAVRGALARSSWTLTQDQVMAAIARAT